MLGERSDQRGLWEADQLYLDLGGRQTFYGLQASLRSQLFRDADFAELYCLDNGWASILTSLLARALLLQTYDKVSDGEAKARADFDIWWKVALGIEIEERPFAKSTLQVFRAQLILHDKVRQVFEVSLRLAREAGYLCILGRAAVKDTHNLLADGIVKLMRVLAALENVPVRQWAETRGYQRYVSSSVKGETAVDWSDRRARRKLWGEIVAYADRLLELARQARALQQSADYNQYRKRRVVAEHRLARLGIRQARYFGRAKDEIPVVSGGHGANLTLVAGQMVLTDDSGDDHCVFAASTNAGADYGGHQHDRLMCMLACLRSALLPLALFPNRAFRPAF